MEAAKVAPLAAVLLSDAAAGISGQIFGVRANEMYIFTQNRIARSIHRSEGWTAESVVDTVLPAFRAHLTPLERSPDVISWDPF
jgi:hypothetical protein